MKKSLWNVIIDALSLVVFMAMISTGLLLKFVLPPGSGRVEMLFRGGREKTIDLFLGLSRHEWGEIHFYISLAFLVLLVVHLVLHWSWIAAMGWGTKNSPQPPARRTGFIAILLFIVLAVAFPFFFPAKTLTGSDYRQMKSGDTDSRVRIPTSQP